MAFVTDYRAITGLGSVNGYDDNGNTIVNRPVFLTYSFEENADGLIAAQKAGESFVSSFQPLSEIQRQNARAAFQEWDEASGVTFREVPSGMGDIRLAVFDFDKGGSYSSAQADGYAAAPNWGAAQYIFVSDKARTPWKHLFLHEIGHTLGFRHPGAGASTLSPADDNYANTVLSIAPNQAGGDTLGRIDKEAVVYQYGDASSDGKQVTSLSWNSASFTLTQVGSDSADRIRGTYANDIIEAGGGNDRIESFEGNDRIFGGDGNDTIFADGDGGIIDGGAGSDKMTLKVSNATVTGGDGADQIQIFGENVDVNGGSGDDLIYGRGPLVLGQGYSSGTFSGGSGNDFISIEGPDSKAFGNEGNDNITLKISGSEWLNRFYIDGGSGEDRLNIDTWQTLWQETTVDLADIYSRIGKIVGIERYSFAGPAGLSMRVTGSAAGEDISLRDGNDYVDGGGGNDRINGGAGDDDLRGGAGDDFFNDNPGDDIMRGGSGIDQVRFQDGLGAATITYENGKLKVITPNGGVDTVYDDIEYLEFNGQTLKFVEFSPAQVLRTLPENGSGGARENQTISFIFSRAISFGNGSIYIRSGSEDGPIFESFEVGSSENITLESEYLNIHLTHGLQKWTKYFVTIEPTAFVDSNGHNMLPYDALEFSTAPELIVNWRLLAESGFSGVVGGSGSVFGTSGVQDISIADQPGYVGFDASFNRGGDILRFAGNAGDWQIVREGSSAILTDGDTHAVISVGTAGMALVFDDGLRTLRYDISQASMMIGDQSFSTTLEAIEASAQVPSLDPGGDPDAEGRLYLAMDGNAIVGGKLAIFGTAGHEDIRVLRGEITLDPSFNRGGDTLHLPDAATAYSVRLAGSSVILSSQISEITIPVGSAGMSLDFAGDERLLRYVFATSSVMLDDQQISSSNMALIV